MSDVMFGSVSGGVRVVSMMNEWMRFVFRDFICFVFCLKANTRLGLLGFKKNQNNNNNM